MSVVLVAEDDPDIRELIAYRLRRAGYDVIDVADGTSALVAATTAVPDLVIADVTMPGTDGLEVCATLRADPRTTEVPVLLLSARARESDVQRGYDSGAAAYLIKPFSPQDLVNQVAELLARGGRT